MGAEVTAAERVKAYLDVRDANQWIRDGLIAFTVANDHDEHQLTVADLREILAQLQDGAA